jgi:acylphosphatase
MEQTSRHIIFTGHVQGVGFRYTARSIANRYEIIGFARNLPDGSVEMFAQGTTEDIDACIEEIQAEFRGYIQDTQIEAVPPNPQYSDFRITF